MRKGGAPKNLKDISQRPDAKELQSKGGKASGVTRRKKRDIKKALETLLAMETPAGDIRDYLAASGLPTDLSHGLAIAAILDAVERPDAAKLQKLAQLAGQTKDLQQRKLERARLELLHAQIEHEKALTERLRADINSLETGLEHSTKQMAAIADLMNQPSIDRDIQLFLVDDGK